jgi:hypothetical protein
MPRVSLGGGVKLMGKYTATLSAISSARDRNTASSAPPPPASVPSNTRGSSDLHRHQRIVIRRVSVSLVALLLTFAACD